MTSQVTHEDLNTTKCSMKEKLLMAKTIRGQKQQPRSTKPYPISCPCIPLSQHPILFHEVTLMNPTAELPFMVQNTLFVLCHGFQGSSSDMINIKNKLKQAYPQSSFLMIRCNEGFTDGDISNMGVRAAKEIEDHI